MPPAILYCGDTHLRNAAAYLGGVLTFGGETFRYVPSDQPLQAADLTSDLRLIVLSDYTAARVDSGLQSRIIDRVTAGMGLLMVGGWESFHGLGGDWDRSPLATVLPVEIGSVDDRLNSDRPLLVRRTEKHAITRGLPWNRRPPYVGGLNRLTFRDHADVLLWADRLDTTHRHGRWRCEVNASFPLLVVGKHGRGRTAALATDLAPHWVGGLVDWGDDRVAAQAPQADTIEVGNWYARFVLQLISWLKA